VEVIVDFIDANRDELGVEPICRDLQVAPSTYYAARSRVPSARARRDAALIPALVALAQFGDPDASLFHIAIAEVEPLTCALKLLSGVLHAMNPAIMFAPSIAPAYRFRL